jgi:hypothetical protein
MGAVFQTSFALACSVHSTAECYIYIATETEILAQGFTHNVIFRHERGHCNGWPGDHKGGRSAANEPQPNDPNLWIHDLARAITGREPGQSAR